MHREFFPADLDNPETGGGTMAFRENNYNHSIGKLTELVNIIVEDCMRAEPPFRVDPEQVVIEKYSGERFKRMWGVEVRLPAGHKPPEDYFSFDTKMKDGSGRPTVSIVDWIPPAS